jgi:hypothetical protein
MAEDDWRPLRSFLGAGVGEVETGQDEEAIACTAAAPTEMEAVAETEEEQVQRCVESEGTLEDNDGGGDEGKGGDNDGEDNMSPSLSLAPPTPLPSMSEANSPENSDASGAQSKRKGGDMDSEAEGKDMYSEAEGKRRIAQGKSIEEAVSKDELAGCEVVERQRRSVGTFSLLGDLKARRKQYVEKEKRKRDELRLYLRRIRP